MKRVKIRLKEPGSLWISHQTLGGADHSVAECLGRDLVQGDDGVPPLQLSLLQQFLTSHLSKDKKKTDEIRT